MFDFICIKTATWKKSRFYFLALGHWPVPENKNDPASQRYVIALQAMIDTHVKGDLFMNTLRARHYACPSFTIAERLLPLGAVTSHVMTEQTISEGEFSKACER